MKYVLLAIFVLFAAQPLQASFCDMHDAQGTELSPHGNMHHGDMQDMDCCDQDSADMDQCGSMSHCGACTPGDVALDAYQANLSFLTKACLNTLDTGEPLNRFKSPPFRPPIS